MPTHAAVIRDVDAEQLHAHQAEAEAFLAQVRGQMQDRSEISDPELRTRHSEQLSAERLAAGRRDGKGC